MSDAEYIVKREDGTTHALSDDEASELYSRKAETIRCRSEEEKLEKRLATADRLSKLRIENLLRIAREKRLDAQAVEMAKCFELGIPVTITLRKPDLQDRIGRKFGV